MKAALAGKGLGTAAAGLAPNHDRDAADVSALDQLIESADLGPTPVQGQSPTAKSSPLPPRSANRQGWNRSLREARASNRFWDAENVRSSVNVKGRPSLRSPLRSQAIAVPS
jgi:hypothetical protein